MCCWNSQQNCIVGDDPEVQVLLKIPQYNDDKDNMVDTNHEDEDDLEVKENNAFEKFNTKAANPSKTFNWDSELDDHVAYENKEGKTELTNPSKMSNEDSHSDDSVDFITTSPGNDKSITLTEAKGKKFEMKTIKTINFSDISKDSARIPFNC